MYTITIPYIGDVSWETHIWVSKFKGNRRLVLHCLNRVIGRLNKLFRIPPFPSQVTPQLERVAARPPGRHFTTFLELQGSVKGKSEPPTML